MPNLAEGLLRYILGFRAHPFVFLFLKVLLLLVSELGGGDRLLLWLLWILVTWFVI